MNAGNISTTVAAMSTAASANTAALSAAISSVNSAAALQNEAVVSTLRDMREASDAAGLARAATDGRTATLSTALQALVASTAQSLAPLNASIAAAMAAATAASTPQVYIQWGSRMCTAPGGVAVVKLCEFPSWRTRSRGVALCTVLFRPVVPVCQTGRLTRDCPLCLFLRLPSQTTASRTAPGTNTPAAAATSCASRTPVATKAASARAARTRTT